jgi:hypothetical protein
VGREVGHGAGRDRGVRLRRSRHVGPRGVATGSTGAALDAGAIDTFDAVADDLAEVTGTIRTGMIARVVVPELQRITVPAAIPSSPCSTVCITTTGERRDRRIAEFSRRMRVVARTALADSDLVLVGRRRPSRPKRSRLVTPAVPAIATTPR